MISPCTRHNEEILQRIGGGSDLLNPLRMVYYAYSLKALAIALEEIAEERNARRRGDRE